MLKFCIKQQTEMFSRSNVLRVFLQFIGDRQSLLWRIERFESIGRLEDYSRLVGSSARSINLRRCGHVIVLIWWIGAIHNTVHQEAQFYFNELMSGCLLEFAQCRTDVSDVMYSTLFHVHTRRRVNDSGEPRHSVDSVKPPNVVLQ